MRYAVWVSKVFEALGEVAPSDRNRVGLTPVAEALGLGPLGWSEFSSHTAPADALNTAMHDLQDLGLVWYENVGHGNHLTSDGRDALAQGLDQIQVAAYGICVSDKEQAFLARLYEKARIEEADWADLAYVDAEEVYREIGLEQGDMLDISRRLDLLNDLNRKGLIRRESSVIGNKNSRPTFSAAVLLTEEDPRFRGREAGIIDWSIPTAGFEEIEGRLADLKLALAATRTEEQLKDIGRRCRDLPADAIAVVFRPEMVPSGQETPSPKDAKRRLDLYLAARAPGSSFEDLRTFLRASLALSNDRTHSSGTGHAGATISAQGVISFVRALQAVERQAMLDNGESDPIPPV